MLKIIKELRFIKVEMLKIIKVEMPKIIKEMR